jgi:pimeloyl-ACP methyl ester carboxylesterase
VLAPVFHAWERHLASISKDRVVRPFEWGLEWLPPRRFTDGPPEARAAAWVDDVMRDSQGFFTPPVTTDFVFEDAPSETQSRGEAGTLRFPSALVTPYPENNVVTARWFPSEAARMAGKRGTSGERGPAVLVMSQWNANGEGHIGLARLLAKYGISALRMSLPYHDVRMPPELARADYIVSANVVRTVQSCRQAVLDARRAIDWLASQGFDRIGILGTSLGSCLALLTTAHEPRIKAQALNHVSPWFADVVWRGLSTQHVRDGLKGHIELDHLRKLWLPISPWSYLDRLRNVRSLLVYGRYDLTFPVDLSRILVDEFARRLLPHEVAALPCGHYTSGMAPFKYLDAYVLIRFLRKELSA